MRYFKVTAKGGHVGKGFYYKANFFVKAENASEAASITRNLPRVKHDHSDAILNVMEIDMESFIAERTSEYSKPWYKCRNKQEQTFYMEEIMENVYRDNHSYIVNDDNLYRKKHSLNYVYNFDPLYNELKSFRGNVPWDRMA